MDGMDCLLHISSGDTFRIIGVEFNSSGDVTYTVEFHESLSYYTNRHLYDGASRMVINGSDIHGGYSLTLPDDRTPLKNIYSWSFSYTE